MLCLTTVNFSCFEKHSSFRTTILAERPAYKFTLYVSSYNPVYSIKVIHLRHCVDDVKDVVFFFHLYRVAMDVEAGKMGNAAHLKT